ncbi:hypothetical protein [Corticicoccus populi]|uniref:Uncharacterized protein n=1 Tax=Corticicoccus populi TaxID=1812821 RepID=A0ABW5WV53_9STAP
MQVQNSYLQLLNYERATSLQLIQGDKSKISLRILDKSQKVMEKLNGKTAQISIIQVDGNILRELIEVQVENSKVTFNLETVLEATEHEIRVQIEDYFFPSSSATFKLIILPAHNLSDVDVSKIETIDIVVDALREDVVTEAIRHIDNNKEKFKGDKGDKGEAIIVQPKIYTREEYENLEEIEDDLLYIIVGED